MKLLFGCCAIALLAASAFGTSDVADAAMKGNKPALRALLDKKANVNAPQLDGITGGLAVKDQDKSQK